MNENLKDQPLRQVLCEKCKKGLQVFTNLIEGVISVDCKKCGHRNVIKVDKKVYS